MQVLLLMATALRVRLDRTYFVKIENWKHYSKIIFKCVNSIVKSIFNEKIAEKWYLWIPYTVHKTHRTDKSDENVGKVWLLFMNSSHCPLLQLTKKKKRNTKRKHEIHCYPNVHWISLYHNHLPGDPLTTELYMYETAMYSWDHIDDPCLFLEFVSIKCFSAILCWCRTPLHYQVLHVRSQTDETRHRKLLVLWFI